jgi:hypothetical protein
VELIHLDLSFRLSTGARNFLNLFQDLSGAILLVVGDMPIDNEARVVTSSISRTCRLNLSKVLIGVELCVCI